MRDPVILPSSKTTIDLSTIKSHLLSDPTDPFNRVPLKLEECVPGQSTALGAICEVPLLTADVKLFCDRQTSSSRQKSKASSRRGNQESATPSNRWMSRVFLELERGSESRRGCSKGRSILYPLVCDELHVYSIVRTTAQRTTMHAIEVCTERSRSGMRG